MRTTVEIILPPPYKTPLNGHTILRERGNNDATKPLYRSLDENLAFLEEMFGRSDDFYTKRLMIAGIRCAIVMFTGLSSPEKLCRMALDMLDRDPAMLGGGAGLCELSLDPESAFPPRPRPLPTGAPLWSCSAMGCPCC